MDDYIKRREALRPFVTAPDGTRYDLTDCDNLPVQANLKDVRKILRRIPAADVRENERGKWILSNKGYLPMVFACSVCGGKHKDAADMFSFCPFCGAIMDDDWE